MKTVQTIYDVSMERRVVLFESDDRSFGFEEQRFSREPLEMCWVPVGKPPHPNTPCDTVEQASLEACRNIYWLSASLAARAA